MNRTNVHLLDLSNDLILMILKKLNNIDVLYLLLGIDNKRLDNLVQNTVFTSTLNFVFTSSTGHISSIDAPILDRFCNYILPRIHQNVKCLILEPLSMARILLSTHYPNLTELKLLNFDQEIVSNFCINDSVLRHISKHSITDLIIMTNDEYNNNILMTDYNKNVYVNTLTVFENLKHLSIIPSSITRYPPMLLYNLPSTTFFSSILTKLCINLATFDDCLSLLDGRLKQLSTFIIEVSTIHNPSLVVPNEDDLPNLKCFSLMCRRIVHGYNNQVVSLLRRMSHLEKLTLYLRIRHKSTFINGSHLNNDILMNMPQLHSFTFYISTDTYNGNHLYVSNHDVQQTFTNKGYQQASCIVNYFPNARAICHIFSLPFAFDHLECIANRFPTIVFNRVTFLRVYDFVPFEHEFFIRIATAFPLLKCFNVMNLMPQVWNVNGIQSNDNQSYSIVAYSHLISLDLRFVCIDYIEEFLLETKTHLLRPIELKVRYDQLKTVTKNFTNDATRLNCANVKRLITEPTLVYLQEVYDYFPSFIN